MNFLYALSQLPSVDHFFVDIVDELDDRKNMAFIMPPQIDSYEIESLIRQKMLDRGLNVENVFLPDLKEKISPISQIASIFSINWVHKNCPMTVENLLLSSGLPDCMIFIGFSKLKYEDKILWIEFLNNWNNVTLSSTHRYIIQKPSLCFIISGYDELSGEIDAHPQLSSRYWFGIPSALEIRLLCRFSNNFTNHGNGKARWLEYMIPSLVGSDVFLVELIQEVLFSDNDDIIDFFSQDAVKKSWTKNNLSKWGLDSFFAAIKKDKGHKNDIRLYYELIARGVLCRTLEYGTEIHASALAAINDKEQIISRIWRGQLSLLLPMVDNIRLFICDLLTERYGEGWPLYFPPKEAEELELVKANPRACQLGHLYYTMQNYQQFAAEREYLVLMRAAKNVRNELAHYRPIEYSDYSLLFSEARKHGIKV